MATFAAAAIVVTHVGGREDVNVDKIRGVHCAVTRSFSLYAQGTKLRQTETGIKVSGMLAVDVLAMVFCVRSSDIAGTEFVPKVELDVSVEGPADLEERLALLRIAVPAALGVHVHVEKKQVAAKQLLTPRPEHAAESTNVGSRCVVAGGEFVVRDATGLQIASALNQYCNVHVSWSGQNSRLYSFSVALPPDADRDRLIESVAGRCGFEVRDAIIDVQALRVERVTVTPGGMP